MFHSKQGVPNDQVNWWFPLLIKFYFIDERLECLLIFLFMYTFYLLPQNGTLSVFSFSLQNIIFSATKIYLFSIFFCLVYKIT